MTIPYWILLPLFSSPQALAEPSLLPVDSVRSALVAVSAHGGLLGFGTHQHAILATRWHAALRVDRKNLQGSGVEVAAITRALELDSQEARRVAGIPGPPPAGEDIAKLSATLKESLEPERFAELRFSSEEIVVPGVAKGERTSLDGPRELLVKGKLTLHGVSREVSFQARVEPAENGTYRFHGKFPVRQRDFKLKAAPGDTLEIRFDLQTEPETVVASAR